MRQLLCQLLLRQLQKLLLRKLRQLSGVLCLLCLLLRCLGRLPGCWLACLRCRLLLPSLLCLQLLRPPERL